MIYPLIIIFAILFFFLCWRNVRWGLYLVIVCLPAYGVRFTVGWLPMTLLELMILILFVVWAVKAALNKEKFTQSKFVSLAALVLLIATVSMFLAPDLIRAAGIWRAYFLEPFLFFVVFINLVKNKKEICNVILALGAPVLAISIFAIIQKLAGGWLVPYQYWYLGEGRRVTSFFSYPNAIGLFVAPIVMLFIGHISYLISRIKGRIWDIRYGIWELVFSVVVILTGILAIWFARSEGAMVGLIAGLIIFGLLIKKTRWLVIILLLCCFIILLLVGIPPLVWEKVTFSDWSGTVRLSIWSESWELIKDNWLLGVGLTGYQSALVPYHQADYLEIFLYPHNFVFNFWVELGLAGLLTFLYLIGKYFYYGWKVGKLESWKGGGLLSISLIAVMVVILVHGLVDVPFFKNDLAVLWWVFIGMMSVAANNN